MILVLDDAISESQATDMLYRREIHKVGRADFTYRARSKPEPHAVVIESTIDSHGIDVVVHSRIGADLLGATRDRLASLAVESARGTAGAEKMDGIAYLREAKENGIVTPLGSEYEREILIKTAASNLVEASEACRLLAIPSTPPAGEPAL